MNALKVLFALVGWAAGLVAPLAGLVVLATTQDVWLALDSLAALLGVALLSAVAWAVCDVAANVRRLADRAPRRRPTPVDGSPSERLEAAQRHKDAVDAAGKRALENLRRDREARREDPAP